MTAEISNEENPGTDRTMKMCHESPPNRAFAYLVGLVSHVQFELSPVSENRVVTCPQLLSRSAESRFHRRAWIRPVGNANRRVWLRACNDTRP